MAGIKGKNTTPELTVRKGLHRLGLRYRLHAGELPGKPDLVLPRYNAVIFVHGCFWHGHNCHLFKWPASRIEFWRTKIENNQSRDRRQINQLRELKWRVCIVWECSIKGAGKDIEKICKEIAQWVRGNSAYKEMAGETRIPVRIL